MLEKPVVTAEVAEPQRSGSLFGLAAWAAVVFAGAVLGGSATREAGSFYAALDLPAWAPPGAVFGPVWSVFYAMMAVAAWLVWRSPQHRAVRPALVLFLLQLAANALWSWLFFAWRLGAASVLELLLLWGLVLATLLRFWQVRPLAGLLLVPYQLWLSFAFVLNLSVWLRNPEQFV